MNEYDFGYGWVWTHGHLALAGGFALLGGLAWAIRARGRGWRWVALAMAGMTVWAVAAYGVLQTQFRLTQVMRPLTQSFLAGRSGSLAVLDVGAGSGRTTLMVLEQLPSSRVTALDLFAENFGIAGNTEERLRANARAAGAGERVEAVRGNMRQMPLPNEAFDGVVSAYAIDHLNGQGAAEALREVHRVMRPEGQFLLAVLHRDGWVRFVYPFLHGHYYGSQPMDERWRRRVSEAGFRIVEEGHQPGTLYLLCEKARR